MAAGIDPAISLMDDVELSLRLGRLGRRVFLWQRNRVSARGWRDKPAARAALVLLVAEFLGQHPRVTASVVLLDRVANLVEEGIDVAVRIGHLPDSSLTAKRIGDVDRILVASPEYLAARGTPESPSELRLHSVIGFTGLMPRREWRYQDGG